MISAVSAATQTQPVAQATKTSSQKQIRSEPQSATPTDSVTLSKTAQAMPAAMQEATEAPAQTAKEAQNGDLQATRLLAKETAAKSVAK
jgi:hypothetical protein